MWGLVHDVCLQSSGAATLYISPPNPEPCWYCQHLYYHGNSTNQFCTFKRLAAATRGVWGAAVKKKKKVRRRGGERKRGGGWDEMREVESEGTGERELGGEGREWNKIRRKGKKKLQEWRGGRGDVRGHTCWRQNLEITGLVEPEQRQHVSLRTSGGMNEMILTASGDYWYTRILESSKCYECNLFLSLKKLEHWVLLCTIKSFTI